MDRTLRLPRPLAHQLPVLRSSARNKVCVCGRRWGKSTLGLLATVEGHGPEGEGNRGAIDGGAVWWVAPSYPVASMIWRDLKHSLRDAWEDKREDERRIVLPGGGSISVRSADNPDSLRGPGLDGLVMDEAASMSEEAWGEALRPTLADRRGWALFIGTPKGDNWFRTLFDRAGETTGGDWARWQRPTADNPRIHPDEIEAARRDLGPLAFRQEFLAEFVTAGAGMFRREWFQRYRPVGADSFQLPDGSIVPRSRLRVFVTVDLAASVKTTADYTVFGVFGSIPGGPTLLLDLVRERMEGPDIVPRLRALCARWRPHSVWIESNGFQLSTVQEARRAGMPVRAITAKTFAGEADQATGHVSRDKVARAMPLTAAFEGGRMLLPHSAPWLAELESELLMFPEGRHDDQVDVLAYGAAVAAEVPHVGLAPAESREYDSGGLFGGRTPGRRDDGVRFS